MFSVFQTKEYQNLLKKDLSLDPRVAPGKAIMQLSKLSEQKSCLKTITTKTKNGLKILRRLTFCHLLIMYSNNFYGMVQKFVECEMLSEDEWLNNQIMKPYYFFLRKVLSSTEMYNKVKQPFQSFSFQKQFYIYNILMEMFKIVAKMPLLGRYYKDNNPQCTCSLVETIAVQAQKMYLPWKTGLQELFTNSKSFITSKGDQQLIKVLIEECLPVLNEQMKKLFLDKYFYPYGKGIGIRLYRTEEQNEQVVKTIKGILEDHKDTERRQAREELQGTLFPQQGKFNYNFFEESIIPKNSSKRIEINVSDDEDDEVVNPVIFDGTTTLKEKDQKETSDHMEYCEEV